MKLPVICGMVTVMLTGCGSAREDHPGSAATTVKPPRADLIKVPDELNKPIETIVSQAFVDIVNETGTFKISDQERVFHAKSDAPLWIRGWAYDDTAQKVPNRVWVELTGKASGLRFFIAADRMERADVASGFKVPWARKAGFATPVVRDHNIPPGAYDVKIYQIDGDTVELTRYYATGTFTVIFE